MKALTLKQPYASLVVLGIKEWETRPAPFNGNMRPAGVRGLPGLCIDRGERIAIHAAASMPIRKGTRRKPSTLTVGDYEVERDGAGLLLRGPIAWPYRLPVGAIVGYATVAEVLPIVAWRDHRAHIRHIDDELWVAEPAEGQTVDPGLTETVQSAGIITDQLPYGYWTPGRWASRLVDPEPCDPIPAKGKQGVWEWTP
jgi:hypothetical protein